MAQGQVHKTPDALQRAELANVDDEDVDLDGGSEDVEEGEHQGQHGDAQHNHAIIQPTKKLGNITFFISFNNYNNKE